MDKVRVSIIMPVHNEALYIRECLDSIIAQQEQNWELIAVDDFSTDQSWIILKEFAERDNRIQILKNTSKGIIPALQLGFAKSNGSYITRMDADDIMSTDRLSAMLKVLENKSSENIAIGLVEYFSKDGISDGYFKYQNWLNSLTTTNRNFEDIYKECVIPSPCWMTSRNNLLKCGAFDSELYPEDYDLTFRFYINDCKVIGIPKILHKWRDYPARSSRIDPNYNDNRFLNLKLHYFLQKDWKGKDIVVWGAGKKGKFIANYLRQKEISFTWICNNPQKIGKEIYGVILESSQTYDVKTDAQFLLAVAAKNAHHSIESEMTQLNLTKNVDYFWFC